ncbi:hypothetical protein GCM10023186_43220 [Hymenobacter koreensis]|uniref:DUF3108 domain-containing protein n=1 Tax=Hymenobacter koreensis TaxID=1084523 RepID=A0ABP8JL98_9BACT
MQCGRENPEPALVPLPAGLKAYAHFLPGTHWVYRDSASGRLDSVWVVSARTYIDEDKERNRWISKTEQLVVRTASSRESAQRVYRSGNGCPTNPDSSSFNRTLNDVRPCWWVERGVVVSGDQDGASSLLLPYVLRVEQRELVGGDFAVISAYRHRAPQRLLGGRVFSQVVELSTAVDLSESGNPARYWWAKGLGIVQWRVHRPGGTQTRTLVRERIVQ